MAIAAFNKLASALDFNTLDGKLAQIMPYLKDIHDDLPLYDLTVEWSELPNTIRVGIELFLEDATIHAYSQQTTFQQALDQSVDLLLDKLKQYAYIKKHAKSLREAAFH